MLYFAAWGRFQRVLRTPTAPSLLHPICPQPSTLNTQQLNCPRSLPSLSPQSPRFVPANFSVNTGLSPCPRSFHLYVRARAHTPFQHLSLYKKRHFLCSPRRSLALLFLALDLWDRRPSTKFPPSTKNFQPSTTRDDSTSTQVPNALNSR